MLSLSSKVAKHTFSSFIERKYNLEPRAFMPNFKLEQIFKIMLETSGRRRLIMKNADLFLTPGMAVTQ